MELNVTHFDGDIEELGRDFGETFSWYFEENHQEHFTHNFQGSAFLYKFFRGLREVTGIEIPELYSTMIAAQHKPTGRIRCLGGNMLACTYKFDVDDKVQVYYGQLSGKPFFFMSMMPHVPGSLLGINRSGLAWADSVHPYLNDDAYERVNMANYNLDSWGDIIGLKLRRHFVLAAPYSQQYVNSQEEYRHKPMPTAENYARNEFEGASSPSEVLVLLESGTREATIIRGSGSERTYNILQE